MFYCECLPQLTDAIKFMFLFSVCGLYAGLCTCNFFYLINLLKLFNNYNMASKETKALLKEVREAIKAENYQEARKKCEVSKSK